MAKLAGNNWFSDWRCWVIVGVSAGVAVIAIVLTGYFARAAEYAASFGVNLGPKWLYPLLWAVVGVLSIVGTYVLIYYSAAGAQKWKIDLWAWVMGAWTLQMVCIVLIAIMYNVVGGAIGVTASLGLSVVYMVAVVAQIILAGMMPAWWALFITLPILAWAASLVAFCGIFYTGAKVKASE